MASREIKAETCPRRCWKTVFSCHYNTRIHRAARKGNLEKVKRILDRGEASVDDTDRKNRTPLHHACSFGNLEVVALLIENKCKLDLLDKENNTPLMKATEYQHEECVKFLLNNGANPNVQDSDGYCALHCAIFCETTSILEDLLSHHANMELENKDGHTPLLYALKHNKKHMAVLLMQNKANIHAVDKKKRTALMLAAKYEANPIVEQLLQEGINVFAEDQSGRSALSYAMASGFNVKIIYEHTRTKFPRLQNSDTEGNDSSTSPTEAWTTSHGGNNKSDTKNVPKGKEEVCEKFQQARRDAKCVAKSGENQGLHDNKSDPEEEHVFSAPGERLIKVKSLHGSPPTSPEPNNVGDGKGEACENFQSSRNYAKCVAKSGEKQGLHDNKSDSEEEHVFSAPGERLIKVKSLHGSPPTSPEPNNVGDGKGEACENFQSSRNYAKCVAKSGEKQGLHDNKSDSEEEHVFSAPGERLIKVKSLHGSPPTSPEPNNICEGKAEVFENFQQSRNDVKCDPGNQKHLALFEKNISENERELAVSNTCGRHIKEKSFSDAPQLLPDSKVEEKNKEHPIEREESRNLYKGTEGIDDESTVQREITETEHERFSLRKYQEHDGLTEVASNEKGKVEKQASAMEDLDNLCQSSETASKDFELAFPNYKKILLLIEQHKASCKDSASLSKIEDAVISSQRTIEDKKRPCSSCLLLMEKFAEMENKFCCLEMKLLEADRVKSELEHKKAEWRQKLFNLRCDLQEEQTQRQNAEYFLKKFRNQLRQKEEDYNKEREIKTQLEISLKTKDMELSTARNKLIQVSISDETGKDLLDKYHRIEDIIAMKRLEIDTIKHENQAKEQKYFNIIEIIKGKYDDLQKKIKLNEKSLRENLCQYNEQFNKMKDEITMLNFQLENEKQNRETLETEVKFYHARVTAAPCHPQESQTANRYQELNFHRARDEYLHSQAQINFDLSRLKVNSEVVSQELTNYEVKVSSLENKLHQTTHDLKEMNLVVENVQRDLWQTQGQMNEIKHTCQSEQTKVNNYDGRQDSTEERLQLQNENTLLQQQMHDFHNSDNKDTVVRIQREFHDIVEKYQAENEKNNLILEKKVQKLINKCDHLEERMRQYENK